MAKDLTEKAFFGFIWMIFGSGIQVILKIAVMAVLARLISPYEFGIMGISIILIDFSKMFTQMGVGPALVQRLVLEHRHLTSGFTLSLAMGIFFGLLLLVLAPIIAIFFEMPELLKVLRVISIIFLVDSFTLIPLALLQRAMKFKLIALFEVLSYLISYGFLGIWLAYQGMGVWSLVFARLAQAIISSILLTWKQPFPKRLGFNLLALQELFFFGGGFTLAKIGNYLAVQGDNLIVGKTLGAGALGIYSRAYQFMVMPANLFGNALDRAVFPAMAKVQDDKRKLGKAYLTGVGLIALISIPISFIFIILSKEIVLILLGENWLDVVLPLQILSGGLLFRMSYKMSESLARATGAVYRRAWRQFIYAFLVLGGSYVGQFWGLPGVAIGVAFALLINFVLMAGLSMQLAELNWLDLIKEHQYGLKIGLIIGVICFGCVSLSRYFIDSNLLILLTTALGVSIPLVIVIYYYPKLLFTRNQMDLLDKLILKKFKKKIKGYV